MDNSYDIKVPWPGWKIVKKLGKGTFGAVYEIERDILGTKEKAAMKMISIPADEAMMDNILFTANYDHDTAQKSLQKELKKAQQEYLVMNMLEGITNIVSCEDFAYQEKEDGIGYRVFIRMELLKSLQRETREKRRKSILFTEEEVVRIGRDVSRALVACDQRGLIHRDIKPSNILVSEYGDYKIGDFGTARGFEHTMQATYAGTQSFMAPEVYRREPYGKTVDLYSLGLVMYWLMNKYHMPFVPLGTVPGTDELQIAETRRVQGEQLPPPCDAGPELAQIILKACSPDTATRYSSASELYRDLTDLSEGRYKMAARRKPNSLGIQTFSSHSKAADKKYDTPKKQPEPVKKQPEPLKKQPEPVKRQAAPVKPQAQPYGSGRAKKSIVVNNSVNRIPKPDSLKVILGVYAACRNENRVHIRKVTGKVFREVIVTGLAAEHMTSPGTLNVLPLLITDQADPWNWKDDPGIKGYYVFRSVFIDGILKDLFHIDTSLYQEPENGVFYRYGEYTYIFEPVSENIVRPQVIPVNYVQGIFSNEITFAAVFGTARTDLYKAKVTMHNGQWMMLSCLDA